MREVGRAFRGLALDELAAMEIVVLQVSRYSLVTKIKVLTEFR
jgi:hypothetical protein